MTNLSDFDNAADDAADRVKTDLRACTVEELLDEVERREIAVRVSDYDRALARIEDLEERSAGWSDEKRDLARVAEHVAAGEIDDALQLLHDLNPQDVAFPYAMKRLVADRAAATAPRLL